MTFYYILWGGFLCLSFLFLFSKLKVPKALLLFIMAIIAGFVACRVNVGADWDSYVSMYNTGNSLDRNYTEYEPLYRFSRWLIYPLGFRYEVYFYIFSFFTLWSVYNVANRLGIKNVYFVFFVYISTIFCSYQLNTVRSGLMAACVWQALAYRVEGNNKASIIWAFVSVGFHYAGLIFVPLLFVVDRVIDKRVILIALAFAYVVMTLGLGSRFISLFPVLGSFERLAKYTDTNNAVEYGITPGAVLNLGLFLYLFFKYRDDYLYNVRIRMVMNVLLIGLVVAGLFNAFGTIVSRIGQVMNISLIYLWPYLLQKEKFAIFKFPLFIVVCIYLWMYFSKALIPSELLGYSTIVPFKAEWNGIFR